METSAPASCANCSALCAAGVYCSTCGEKQLSPHDFALRHFVEHAIHDLTHFDAKIFRSLIPLVRRPGLLTAEFVAGRRTRYIKPLTLFILVNLFFFLIPALALLFVPFARRRYYVEHLVYSIHFHAFLLLLIVVGVRILLIPLGLVAAAGAPGPFRFFSRGGLFVPVLVGIVGYHLVALRRVYGVGWAAALASGVTLTLAEILLVFFVYMPLMFFVVYYSS